MRARRVPKGELAIEPLGLVEETLPREVNAQVRVITGSQV